MTAVRLVKIMTLLQVAPHRLVAQGLASQRLLEKESTSSPPLLLPFDISKDELGELIDTPAVDTTLLNTDDGTSVNVKSFEEKKRETEQHDSDYMDSDCSIEEGESSTG